MHHQENDIETNSYIDHSVCEDLLYVFYRLELFEETLTNRVVRSWQAQRLSILLRGDSETAQFFWDNI